MRPREENQVLIPSPLLNCNVTLEKAAPLWVSVSPAIKWRKLHLLQLFLALPLPCSSSWVLGSSWVHGLGEKVGWCRRSINSSSSSQIFANQVEEIRHTQWRSVKLNVSGDSILLGDRKRKRSGREAWEHQVSCRRYGLSWAGGIYLGCEGNRRVSSAQDRLSTPMGLAHWGLGRCGFRPQLCCSPALGLGQVS